MCRRLLLGGGRLVAQHAVAHEVWVSVESGFLVPG